MENGVELMEIKADEAAEDETASMKDGTLVSISAVQRTVNLG